MASRRIEERRAYHKRYKEDVERTGKPFFPYAMFHDTVMSLVVVTVIAMGTLTYKGATARESLASETKAAVPNWVKRQGLPQNAVPGANLFAESGCLTCHTYLGTGSSNLGAPDLSAEGAKGRGLQFQINHLKCPSCVNPGSPMPPFKAFSDADLRKLAIFIEASKGPK